MKLRLHQIILLGVVLTLVPSCGMLDSKDRKKTGGVEMETSPAGASGIPPQLRPKQNAEANIIAAGGNTSGAVPNLSQIVSDDDLIFTDPDNPNANLPELSTILENKKRGPWEASEAIAKQRSVSEGKPLLIWFTNSMNSPMCLALSQELFSQHEFGDWASEKIVRLRVDQSAKLEDDDLGLDQQMTQEINIKQYVEKLRKKYKVLGTPTLIMTKPNGDVILRRSGYKRGDSKFVLGQIQHAEAVSLNSHKAWKKSLEGKGYRDWNDRKGRKVFAKMVNYSKGTLTFIEPSGRRSRTSESALSDQDRQWIVEQKKLRGLE